MASTVFPVPSSGSSSSAALGLPVGTANYLYDAIQPFSAAVYNITWATGGTGRFDFWNGSTLLGTVTGTSPLNINLGTAATRLNYTLSVVGTATISILSIPVAPVTGQVYTYTSSGTVTQTGPAWVTLVGGGGGGNGGGGAGGQSGTISGGPVLLTGTQHVTIGAGGAGGYCGQGVVVNGSPQCGSAGGTTSFYNYNAPGGGSGGTSLAPNYGSQTNAGSGAYFNFTFTNPRYGAGTVGVTNAATSATPGVVAQYLGFLGTTGGGGAGVSNFLVNQGYPCATNAASWWYGAGSGIGTGGNGDKTAARCGSGYSYRYGPCAQPGNAASGYGAGGGSGGFMNKNTYVQYAAGGVGSPGVLYVVQ